MSGDSTRPGGPIAVFCAGGACALLGSVTLIGWFFDIPALSRHGLSPQAMAMNTAVGLVLDGLALLGLARGRRGAALPGALWSLLIGALTLVEYGWPANLHIDWVPVPYTLHFLSGGAGRLAPNTAAALVLCGIALLCAWGSRLSARGTTVTGVLGAVVLAFGTTCVFGHLGGHPTYAWGPWKQMAPATGIGFIALGLGLAAVAWQYGARGAGTHPRWLVPAAGCAALTSTLCLAYALERELGAGRAMVRGILPVTVVVMGTFLSTMLASIVNLALTSHRRAEAAQLANARLEREIAERKRVERELLDGEERFRSAFEEAPFGLCLAALDGRLMQVNETFCQLVGRSAEELLSSGWQALTHPDDLAISQDAVDRLLRGVATFMEYEKRYIGSRGDLVWARLRISLVRDGRGNPSHLVAHAEDITARKQAERTSRQREERFRAAFEYAPFGMGLTGADRRLIQVNATLCHVLGYSQEELLARSWDEVTHPDDRALSHDAITRLERDLPPCVEFEKRYLDSSGQIVWARVRVSVAAGGADGWRFVTHVQDITERKRAGEAIYAPARTACACCSIPRRKPSAARQLHLRQRRLPADAAARRCRVHHRQGHARPRPPHAGRWASLPRRRMPHLPVVSEGRRMPRR